MEAFRGALAQSSAVTLRVPTHSSRGCLALVGVGLQFCGLASETKLVEIVRRRDMKTVSGSS